MENDKKPYDEGDYRDEYDNLHSSENGLITLSNEDIATLKESISSFFPENAQGKLNSSKRNYSTLAKAINRFNKNKLITPKYLSELYSEISTTYPKQRKKVEAINKFFKQYAKSNQTPASESLTRKIVTNQPRIENLPIEDEFSNVPNEVGQVLKNLEDSRYQFLIHPDSEIKTANAIRIVGAADQCFFENQIIASWTNQPYDLPDEMKEYEQEVIAKHLLARKTGEDYHNGLNARLCNFYFHKTDPKTDRKSMTLELGPVRWNDYLVANRHFSKRCDNLRCENVSSYLNEICKYVDLRLLAKDRRIKSTLSNICDTVTTVITQDGYVLFSLRGLSTAVPGLYTSAVAENIHPILDNLTDSLDLNLDLEKDLGLSSQRLDEKAMIKSKWPNINSIFHAVIRGFHEELSPEILNDISPEDIVKYIRCLGISFDLNSLHPDLLFIAILPLDLSTIKRNISASPGTDFREGRIESCLLSNTSGLDKVLSKPNWTGGGKASLLRSLEYLNSLNLLKEFDFNRVPAIK